jgi:glycerol-3-phosphate cytidylyltransferase
MKHYNIGYTTGVFDLFHIGHLNILRQAREYCDYLIVGVTSDELCHTCKHKYPVISLSERMDIVGAIRFVDKVVVQNDMDKLKAVKEYGADAVFVGSDWQNTPQWIEYEKQFAKVGCSVIYIPHTDGTSSTLIKSVIEKLHNE